MTTGKLKRDPEHAGCENISGTNKTYADKRKERLIQEKALLIKLQEQETALLTKIEEQETARKERLKYERALLTELKEQNQAMLIKLKER